MQIVINIDEKIYKRILPYKDLPIISNLCNDYPEITHAIANGVPLPKGHGTLKDTDAICKNIISALGIRDENYLLEAEKAVYKRIKNAPTIIDADEVEE